mmetsp:Transcript_17264/g.28072  ORF Transcript_17264/g.28072 Transcript_17264/m.28072 type:complete len:610 (-) Transcript_17264:1988-3817(-)
MARVQYREKNITTMSCPRCEKNLSIVKIRQDKTTQTPKQGLCTRTLTRHFLNSCASPGTYLGAINFVKMFQRHQYFQQRASNAYQPTAAVIPTCSTVSGARAVAGSNNLHAQNNGLASNMEVEGCEPNPIRNNLHTLSPALQNQHPPPYRWLTRQQGFQNGFASSVSISYINTQAPPPSPAANPRHRQPCIGRRMVGRRRQDGELKVKQQQGLSMNAGPRRERNRTFRRNQLQQQQQNNTSYKLQSSPVHIYSRKDDNFSDIAQEDSTHTQSSDSRRAALATQVLSSSASSTTATPRTAASQMFASSFDTCVIFNLHVTFLIRETGILDSVYHVQKILKLHGSSVELKFLSTAASQSTANAEQHLQSSTYQSLPPHSPTEKSTYVVEIRFPGKNYNDIADRQSCERCVAAAFKKAKIPWSCVRHYTTRPGSIIWTLLLFFMEADQDEVLTRLDALKQFSTYRMVGELQSEYTPQVTIVPAEDYSSMSSFVPSSSSSALSLDPPDSSEEIIAEFEWRVSTSKVQYQRLCRLFEAKGIVNTLLQNRGVGIRGDREKDDVSGETRFPMNKNCLASSLLLQRPPFHTITFKVVYLGSFCSDDLLPECLEGALQ